MCAYVCVREGREVGEEYIKSVKMAMYSFARHDC